MKQYKDFVSTDHALLVDTMPLAGLLKLTGCSCVFFVVPGCNFSIFRTLHVINTNLQLIQKFAITIRKTVNTLSCGTYINLQ